MKGESSMRRRGSTATDHHHATDAAQRVRAEATSGFL